MGAGSRWAATLGLCLAATGTMLAPAHADACNGAGTQLELNACAARDFDKADKALNAAYKTLLDRLDSEAGRKSLVAAQRAWLGFRDGECEFEASSSIGGSLHPMVVTGCRTTLTEARTSQLRKLATCGEGDLACPAPAK